MFERFTDRSRKMMVLANQEAQRLNNEYIGSEHMLLGLLKEGTGVGFHVLVHLGVDPIALRRKVESLLKCGDEVVSMGKLPQTPRAKKVIELAIKESRTLGDNYVGTEHILLGLILEHDSIAAMTLTQFGVQIDAARDAIRQVRDPRGPESESNSRLYYVRHQDKSYWVEAADLKAATAVWKRHFGRVPSGDEHRIEDPDSIEMIFEGPVWR